MIPEFADLFFLSAIALDVYIVALLHHYLRLEVNRGNAGALSATDLREVEPRA